MSNEVTTLDIESEEENWKTYSFLVFVEAKGIYIGYVPWRLF